MDWELIALQNDDGDVASHALFLLCQRAHGASNKAFNQESNQAELARSLVNATPRAWRRLGLLLFSSDLSIVRAVVSIVSALVLATTDTDGDQVIDQWQRPLRERVWQTEWRQFVVEKLTDCHAHASTAMQSQRNRDKHTKACGAGAGVALQLLLVVRAVFVEAVHSYIATPKDQARFVDLFVDLALSPIDDIACVAIQTLKDIVLDAPISAVELHCDVRAYLVGSQVFLDLVKWLRKPHLPKQAARTKNERHDHRRHRQLLAFDLVIYAARYYVDVASAIGLDPELLLGLCLSYAESQSVDRHDLQAHALELIAAVLHHEKPFVANLSSALRLGGALITLSWLLGHTAPAVGLAAHNVITLAISKSTSRDFVRVLVEQGCVLICFINVADEGPTRPEDTSFSRSLLQWVVGQVESLEPSLVESLAASVRRSTNAKLQRNVVLTLLLLSQSSPEVRHALNADNSDDSHSFLHGTVEATLAAQCDAFLAACLVATALLCGDKSSQLKLDVPLTSSSLRKVSRRQLLTMHESATTEPTSQPIALLCQAEERIVIESTALTPHCRRVVLSPDTDCVTLDLTSYNATTVRLLLRLLPLSPPQAALELQREDSRRLEPLLALAKALDCAKCWHAASLAVSSSPDATNWRWKLDAAVRLRHPTLMLRALRMALGASEIATSDMEQAALLVWRELLGE